MNLSGDRQGAAPALLISVVLAVGLIGAGWILGAQIKQTRLADRYVTVKGLVERTVKSDLAIWNLSFRSSGNDFPSVLAQSEAQKAKALTFLKAQGIPDSAIRSAPPRVIDKAAQEYGGNRQANEDRYLVTQTLVITSADVDRIAAATQHVDALLRQGVILADVQPGLPSVTYRFNGLNAIKPDMITEATRNARTAAQRFANDSGAAVGSIRQASQGSFSISGADAGSSDSGDAGEGPGMPGNADASVMKKVRVVTTVEYFLNQ